MILNVDERILVKRYVEAKGVDGNIYSVYICNDIIRRIYWKWMDRNEDGWIIHRSEELPTKSIKKMFGITKREFLKMVEKSVNCNEIEEKDGNSSIPIPF